MESPLLRPAGGLSKPARCCSPIDADTREPKRRRQPARTQSVGINGIPPSPPFNEFSLIPSQEDNFLSGTASHPTFTPSLHGFGDIFYGAATPAWQYYEPDQPYRPEPTFGLVVNSHNMGGGDVPPALAGFPLEMSMAFATHQPFNSAQYVSPDRSWGSESGHQTAHALHHPPVDNDSDGLAQSRSSWESAALPLSHNAEGFHGAFPRAFHPSSGGSAEFQGENDYLLHFQPAYSASLSQNPNNAPREAALQSMLPNGDEGALRDCGVVSINVNIFNPRSPYANIAEQCESRLLSEPQAPKLEDIDEQVVVPEEALIDIKQEGVADVTQEVVAAVGDKLVIQKHGIRRRRDILMKQTSDTRMMRACIRCHNQRVRCRPNMDNPNDPLAPCVTCLNVRRESKKTIHNLPCLRYKLPSIVMYRDGGLGYTNRFDHSQLIDIPRKDWTDKIIKVIEMIQGLCDAPMRLRVRAFRANEPDDKVDRHLISQEAVRIPAYCLVDVKASGKALQKYIVVNAVPALKQSTKDSDVLLQQVYARIASRLQPTPNLANDPSSEGKQDIRQDKKRSSDQGKQISVEAQCDFLLKAVRLWFTIRHQTGSAWICGEESLGMESMELKARYIPRMIVAQFDSIRYHMVFKTQVPQLLKMYEEVLTSWQKAKGAWFTAFMVTFLFLHNVACICQDRRRHALENSRGQRLATRYGAEGHSLTQFVEDVQHGAAVMLAHWAYFKRCDLMNFDWDTESVSKSALQQLEPEELAFLKSLVDSLKTKMSSIPTTPEEGCWEHELYWVSLMFVTEPSMTSSWKPPVIFSVVNPSVGNRQ